MLKCHKAKHADKLDLWIQNIPDVCYKKRFTLFVIQQWVFYIIKGYENASRCQYWMRRLFYCFRMGWICEMCIDLSWCSPILVPFKIYNIYSFTLYLYINWTLKLQRQHFKNNNNVTFKVIHLLIFSQSLDTFYAKSLFIRVLV